MYSATGLLGFFAYACVADEWRGWIATVVVSNGLAYHGATAWGADCANVLFWWDVACCAALGLYLNAASRAPSRRSWATTPAPARRLEWARGQMALVSQEVVIFDQTVAENIACGKLDASREEIVAAAKAANAHEFIEGLPEGYDTRLGEQGTRLSGGQRQRIAIARAFVRQGPILILDEATAALDSKAESEVQGAIDRLEKGRTVVCVAHRLSTLRGMDKIIVLEEGRVVEEGGFAELLERDGVFAEMARKQGLAAG